MAQNSFDESDKGKTFQKVMWHFDHHSNYQIDFLGQGDFLVLDVQLAEEGQMRCHVCKTLAEKYCARCKKVAYCSRDCQRRDWKLVHRQVCGHLTLDQRYGNRKHTTVVKIAEVAHPERTYTLRATRNEFVGWAPSEKVKSVPFNKDALDGHDLMDHLYTITETLNVWKRPLSMHLPNALDQTNRVFQCSLSCLGYDK